ncbi:synaptobrevin [Chytriomyces sp. MP71]|nr:synaptobrevin [Chytriomyces sp. MP71]
MASSSNSKVNTVQKQVDEVVNLMNDNIAKVVQRGENLEQLQDKTEGLQQSALQFKKGASDVRKAMWWKDMKMKMILGGILLVIIIIIIREYFW